MGMRVSLMLLCLGFVCGGCDSGDGGYPNAVKSFLDSKHISRLKERGLEVYPGSNPPMLDNGQTYVLNSQRIIYSDSEPETVGQSMSDMRISFAEQKPTEGIARVRGTTNSNTPMGYWLSGDGECFTLYLDSGAGCGLSEPQLISGCLRSDGIHDVKRASIVTGVPVECEPYFPGYKVMDVFLVEETDRLAEIANTKVDASGGTEFGCRCACTCETCVVEETLITYSSTTCNEVCVKTCATSASICGSYTGVSTGSCTPQ
jgi:hypothetical protein